MDTEHKDPYKLDLTAPRLAWYKQKTWKKHQNTVYWVDIKLAQKKGFKFYQTRSNAIILYNTLPAYCIPRAIKMETGEIIYEKEYASPRPPPTISYQCLLYWNQGVIYCTCGHFLVESESRRKVNKLRLDALSIPHYVIKKGRCHGARHGKTEEQKEYHIAFNMWKRCCKRVDSQDEHFKGIHDRFLRDHVYRESQLKIGWTELKCIEMDDLAQQDHTHRLSREEVKRYQGQWYLTLIKSGKNAPMRLRQDFRAAVSLKNRLHRESGEQIAEPVGDGILPQAIPGGTGTRPKAGGAHDIF